MLLPVSNVSVLMSVSIFYLLYQVAFLLRYFHLVLALVLAAQLVVFVLPALMRYLMQLLEARARGQDPEPLSAETLTWIGNVWSLFPLVPIAITVYTAYGLGSQFGTVAVAIIALLFTIVMPASLAILAVTHTPLHSLRPAAILEVMQRSGAQYFIGPVFSIAAGVFVWWLHAELGIALLTEFIAFLLLFAGFILFGEVVRPLSLHDEVDIYEPADTEREMRAELQERGRTMALNHAYGFASRGNVAGALRYLFQELDKDPDSATGWPWYLDRMLNWHDANAALLFAQQYLKRLLLAGENMAAMKLITRCRQINTAFRPLPEDQELALAAAEACHNEELIHFLRNPL